MFGFSQLINELNLQARSEKRPFILFSFSNYHLNIRGLFLFTCAISAKSTISVLDAVVYCFVEKLLIYRSITTNVIGFKLKKNTQ